MSWYLTRKGGGRRSAVVGLEGGPLHGHPAKRIRSGRRQKRRTDAVAELRRCFGFGCRKPFLSLRAASKGVDRGGGGLNNFINFINFGRGNWRQASLTSELQRGANGCELVRMRGMMRCNLKDGKRSPLQPPLFVPRLSNAWYGRGLGRVVCYRAEAQTLHTHTHTHTSMSYP